MSHSYLGAPAQSFVAKFLGTFKEYPQRQKAASFNLDDVMRQMTEHQGSK
jgi:arylsulfatase